MLVSRTRTNRDWDDQRRQSVFAQCYPGPLELIELDHADDPMPIGSANNTLVRAAKGADYVYYLGDDDWLSWEAVAVLVREILELDSPVVSSYCWVTDERGVPYAIFASATSVMWRRDYLLAHPYPEDVTVGVDTAHRLAFQEREGAEGFPTVDVPLYYYRWHPPRKGTGEGNVSKSDEFAAWGIEGAREHLLRTGEFPVFHGLTTEMIRELRVPEEELWRRGMYRQRPPQPLNR